MDISSLPQDATTAMSTSALTGLLQELRERLVVHFSNEGTKLKLPILAISENSNSFLTDAIASQNKRFASVWPSTHAFERVK